MFANRISYAFDFQGPSYTMDTACSSSFLALQQAFQAIRTNQCDQAIVGGVNICVRPASSLQFHKLNMLSPDGKCHHLDSRANGYVRSESCSVIFLQRKNQAKRIYATIINAKTNTDGHKDEGITFPSYISQRNLMKEVVSEAKINPLDVVYVEAHGTGTMAGDPVETKSIANVYCVGRTQPLLIGSVKTNLGHAEPASGLNSIAKMLVTFENRMIPANLHYKSPNTSIPELINGLVKPVDENTPYDGGIVAINSFGFGGVNVHVLLKPNQKEIPKEQAAFPIIDRIPRLILATGRTEESVDHIFDFIEKNPTKITREFLSLLQDVSMTEENSGMNYRGFVLMDNQPDCVAISPKEIHRISEKRPVWFVYSGMGSQWNSMAKKLMCIDVFRKSIEKSAAILKPYEVDLMELLLSEDENALEATVSPFVAIAAIQIALTDILRLLRIEPDGIVGHSVGELGCAYADQAFDHEQMLLSAYWRGKCVEEANLPKGLMAAVGLTWDEARNRCPKGVVPACHNSLDSVTISGEYEATKKLVDRLKSENIFAREVKSCGVAFHSYFMEAIAPSLKAKLEKIIPDPKLRSDRWISSSFPKNRWNEEKSKFASPSYFVNNLTSPVLFHEAIQEIPKNAIVIEIAPHSLLQAIIKRTLGSEICYVSFMKRNYDDNLNLLLSSIGRLYKFGLNPDIKLLYPKIEYPVCRGVQSIGSLIKWDHSQTWTVCLYPEFFNPNNKSDFSIKIDLKEKSDQFFAGHCIDGRILFPATGYLYLAWQMLAKIRGQSIEKTPVEFENVTLHRATIMNNDTAVKFEVQLMESTGEFTISEGGSIVVDGRIFAPESSPLKLQSLLSTIDSRKSNDAIELSSKDIYKELRLRGYDYGSTFQGIHQASSDSKVGRLKYSNWIVLADTMLQMSILSKKSRGLYLPVRFQSVRCDPKILQGTLDNLSDDRLIPVLNDLQINSILVPGIEIQGLKVNLAPRRLNQQVPVLESYTFNLFDQQGILDQKIHSDILKYDRIFSKLITRLIDHKNSKEENNIESAIVFINENPFLSYLNNFAQENRSNNEIETLAIEFKNLIDNDIISNAYESERYLRVLINFVVENLDSSRCNIIEINRSKKFLVPIIKKNIDSFGGLPISIDYTLMNDEDDASIDNCKHKKINGLKLIVEKSEFNDLIVFKDDHSFSSTKSSPTEAKAIDYKDFLDFTYQSLKPNGFLLAVFHRETESERNFLAKLLGLQYSNENDPKEFITLAQRFGLRLIARRDDNLTSCLLLFRKINESLNIELNKFIHIHHSNPNEWIELLKRELIEVQKKSDNHRIWLIADDHPANGVVGLMKCLRLESGGQRLRCLLSSSFKNTSETLTISDADENFKTILQNDLLINVYRDGQFGTFIHLDINNDNFVETEHAFLNVATKGDLSSLRWYESDHKYWREWSVETQKKNGNLFTVYYAPLNFRDIMLASGKLPPDALPGDLALQDCILGLEFSGRDEKGQRMMGMVEAKGLATSVLLKNTDLLWPIPEDWPMDKASTVPVAYSTAYYALCVRGNLEPGETVLIHSGSGGVGQAAISICLHMKCKVFTTVGSEEKKEYLKQRFPQLDEKSFANSRDASFEQHILRETDGRGVDVVLNSLSEEKLQASVRCLAQHGRFLEIGKYDLSQNNPLGMAAFLKNITFHGILLDSLLDDGNDKSVIKDRQMVAKLVFDGIKSGAVQPLNCNLFDMNDCELAFRFMASGKHIGKVVLRIRDEELEDSKSLIKPEIKQVKALARTIFLPNKTYIIVGGLGGFGLELARWMIEKGAEKIILTSRTGPKNAYQHYCMQYFEQKKIIVKISTANIVKKEETLRLLKEASLLGPVGGIFNLAMVLNDALFENLTPEDFQVVCASKVDGTMNLDRESRQHCPELDYFVCFSSISCGRGNVGQSNYGFANSSMERICEIRRSQGLHGLAIQWGAIGDVGVVSETMGGNEIVIGGTVPQRIPSCMNVLDYFLQSTEPVCCSYVPSVRQHSSQHGSNRKDLIRSIARILGVPNVDDLSPGTSLAELGMDSLMGVEVKQFLERDYEIAFSMQELRSLTIANLLEISNAAENSQLSSSISKTNESKSDSSIQSSKRNDKLQLSSLIIEIPKEKYCRLNQIEKGKPIYFIPPIEGDFSLLKILADQIKRPVYGLNWTKNLNEFDSIEKVSKYFIDLIRIIENNARSDCYNLVGYSFGTILAFEIAIQLKRMEPRPKINLIFLDSSPIFISKSLQHYQKTRDISNRIDEFESEALVNFLMQNVSINHDEVKKQLIDSGTLEKRLKRVVEIIQTSSKMFGKDFTTEMIETAAISFIRKFWMIHQYEINQNKFDDEIILIRAKECIYKENGSQVDDDYEISKVNFRIILF